jgi:hypothetical protein
MGAMIGGVANCLALRMIGFRLVRPKPDAAER